MQARGPNSELIRVALIVFFLMITQIIRLVKKSNPPRREGMGSPLDTLREAQRQLREKMGQTLGEVRAPQGPRAADGETLQLGGQLPQPPTIEPESSFLPSVLLVALLVCLGLMAYRYWGR